MVTQNLNMRQAYINWKKDPDNSDLKSRLQEKILGWFGSGQGKALQLHDK